MANFVSKLRRKHEKYVNPLEEVTDLSGIRLVLYYLDDVELVRKIIEDQFNVDAENSVDKGALMDPDRFGYLSVHYVVRPSPTRAALPEWTEFANLNAEIQVRTVLQHAWGAISRKLAYASVREAPRDLQRGLNRLSALLELADTEFINIRSAREKIEEQYDLEVVRGNLDLEIDESSLDVYLRESGVGDRIFHLAQAAGSPTGEEKAEAYLEEGEDKQEFLQGMAQNEKRDLVAVLDSLGFTRISALDDWLAGLWGSIPDFMRHVNENYSDHEGLSLSAAPRNWLCIILLWSCEASAKTFSGFEYVDEIVKAVSTYGAPFP